MTDSRKFSLSNYPLCWPDGWKRTDSHRRKIAHFKRDRNRATVALGVDRILEELRSMGISKDDVLISTNIPTRLDGMPRSDQSEPKDSGVSVYWRKNQNTPTRCIAIDIYTRVADNLCAIAATLEALRAIERHGGAQVQERSFRGFQSLPAEASAKKNWRKVLGLETIEKVTRQHIETEFRFLARERHPDMGGTDELMAELNVARAEALAEVG